MTVYGNQNLAGELNRLANGGATYPATYRAPQGAANAWAGTTGLALLAALNVKNGSSGLGLNLVCSQLAGTSSATSAVASLQQKAS